MEKREEQHVILDSGLNFFDDLEGEIEFASRYIFIKQFLWRNDETGRMVALALIKAMERGGEGFYC